MSDLKLGLEHFNAGRYQEALVNFKAARGPEARCFAAHALDSLGRPQEALSAFASAVEAFPRHLPAYEGLANLMLHRGPFEHEKSTLRRILSLKPQDAESRRRLLAVLKVCAQAFRASGEQAPAEKSLRRILALSPTDADSRGRLVALIRMRAQSCLTALDFGGARKALDEALALAPTDAETRARLADLLRLHAHERLTALEPGAAEKALRAAIAVAPGDAKSRRRLTELLRLRGKDHQSAGRMDDAENCLRAALKLQPRDDKTLRKLLELLTLRAREHVAAGMPALARRSFLRALALDARDKEARGGLLSLMRENAERATGADAERAWRRALAFEPRDVEARRRLVELLRGNLEASLEAGRPVDKALRAALAFSPSDREARLRLAALLRARGLAELFARRLSRAERHFRDVLLCDPGSSSALMSLASVMNAAGKISAERAVLRRAVSAARGRAALGDKFKALMKLRRYKEAFAAAERILDGNPSLPDIRCFWDPWEWDERVSREERLAELAALERALGKAPPGPWLHYYRGSLKGPEALSHFERLADYPAKRYGWMWFKAGLTALSAADFPRAAAWFKRSLAGRPAEWRAHCFLAESFLCRGDDEAAFAAMDRALKSVPEQERGQVLAWRGAFELWLGRYERALVLLDEAESLGAQCAFCWKGAALLKLGRPIAAIAELDRGLAAYPLDFEAYVWRGEAKRELGLYQEALADLNERASEVPSRTTPVWMWARFNRALVRKALGDTAGMIADFDAIPAFVIEHLRKVTGLDKREELLEAGLKLSRGFRRDEYRQAVWMRPP